MINAYVLEKTRSPLAHLECNFNRYVQTRQAAEQMHQDGNSIADYAFGLDYELRKKLDTLGLQGFINTKFGVGYIIE